MYQKHNFIEKNILNDLNTSCCLDNEHKINKRVVSNKKMYTGKKCQKLKRVYMFIRYTRVGPKIYIFLLLYSGAAKKSTEDLTERK